MVVFLSCCWCCCIVVAVDVDVVDVDVVVAVDVDVAADADVAVYDTSVISAVANLQYNTDSNLSDSIDDIFHSIITMIIFLITQKCKTAI